MLSSEMCNHITSAHISYIPTTLEEYVVSTQGFKSERNWEDFNETGCVFNKIYRLEDREQWALVYLIAGTERDSGRLVIAASTLAATKNMDTESLRLGVKVPLKDDEAVTLRLKPQKSTGSASGDRRQMRRATNAVSFATGSLKGSLGSDRSEMEFSGITMSWFVSWYRA